MQRTVIVKEAAVGFHNWPDAPEEVGYLRSPHRHRFTLIVAVNVEHGDRDVEFHMLQRDLIRIVDATFPRAADGVGEFSFGARSTEHIAEELINRLQSFRKQNPDGVTAQPYRNVAWVEVWEDDECGSRVTPEMVDATRTNQPE